MQTKILGINDSSLSYAKSLILNEEIVAFPTETVYGLGASGLSDKAVDRIYEAKGRPKDNPLIAHVHKNYDITKLVEITQDYVKDLIKAFMPGPLTIVAKSKGVVSKRATCGLDSLAIRMPNHDGAQRFLECVDLPIVAPSANISKHTSGVTAEHVMTDFDGKIPLILDGGQCVGGIESTVLNVMEKTPIILRQGLVTREMIEKVVGSCAVTSGLIGAPMSPGMKYGHYKPNCKTKSYSVEQMDLALEDYEAEEKKGNKPYIMCDGFVAEKIGNKNLLNLGKTAEEMATNLYYKLREGEKIASVIIAIMPEGEGGVFDGVKNRMEKAFK